VLLLEQSDQSPYGLRIHVAVEAHPAAAGQLHLMPGGLSTTIRGAGTDGAVMAATECSSEIVTGKNVVSIEL
jgi:hypothetical protein